MKAVAGLFLDEQERQALVRRLHVRIGARQHGEHVRAIGERAPGLFAVELVAVALFDGAQLHRRGVAADVGLGERGGGEQLARGDLRQELLLLLLGAVGHDERAGDDHARHHRAHRQPAARQLLGHDGHRQRVEAHAAVLGREDEAEVAELGHLADDRHRDLFFRVVELVGDRHDFALDELADAVADLQVLFLQHSSPRRARLHRPVF